MENLVEISNDELLLINGGGLLNPLPGIDLSPLTAEIAEAVVTFTEGFIEGFIGGFLTW